jgi:hypothetical protein
LKHSQRITGNPESAGINRHVAGDVRTLDLLIATATIHSFADEFIRESPV